MLPMSMYVVRQTCFREDHSEAVFLPEDTHKNNILVYVYSVRLNISITQGFLTESENGKKERRPSRRHRSIWMFKLSNRQQPKSSPKWRWSKVLYLPKNALEKCFQIYSLVCWKNKGISLSTLQSFIQ